MTHVKIHNIHQELECNGDFYRVKLIRYIYTDICVEVINLFHNEWYINY